MSNKRTDREQMDALADALSQSILEESDDETLTEAKLAGVNPEAEAAQLKSVMSAAVKKFQQKLLREAQAGYQADLQNIQQRSYRKIPETPEGRFDLFSLVIAHRPQYAAMYTTQHRDLKDLTDDDIQSYLEDLEALGVLDELTENNKG